jgi:REP element-mobilizing transposase RayT
VPRPLRLELEGAIYHVVARGNNRRPIFLDDVDREVYLAWLARCRTRYGFLLYAYCLMDNHVHLVIERGAIPLSRIMLALHSFYGQRFNRRHDRVGHLFQGRYKAYLVERDRYLLALLRYVHANPVKASLVTRAERYRWSSARCYRAGYGPGWLDLNRALRLLGPTRSAALERYRCLMERELGELYEGASAVMNTVKGGEEFARRVLSRTAVTPSPTTGWTIESIAAAAAAVEGLSVDELRKRGQLARPSKARTIAAYYARQARIPVSRMAKYFGRDESTLIRAVGKLEMRLNMDRRLRARMMAVVKELEPKSAGVHG